MAEESGKGVALVILGIVAIIAIVGLVLLFTGAGSEGAFAVPGAKAYGGAIKGAYDPYSNAFPGRAYYYGAAGTLGEHSANAETGRGGVSIDAGTMTGEQNTLKSLQAATKGKAVLPESFVYTEARNVKVAPGQPPIPDGAACYYVELGHRDDLAAKYPGVSFDWSSSTNRCYDPARIQIWEVPVFCHGSKSADYVVGSGFEGAEQGQATVFLDEGTMSVQDLGNGLCAVSIGTQGR